jgi:hypothetical protein
LAESDPKSEFLALVPKRAEAQWSLENGCVCFAFPRFRSGIGKRFGRLVRASEEVRLTLDEISSFIWMEIDGRKSVEAIGDAAHTRYGERIEPVYSRLATFLGDMQKRGLVRYSGVRARSRRRERSH